MIEKIKICTLCGRVIDLAYFESDDGGVVCTECLKDELGCDEDANEL